MPMNPEENHRVAEYAETKGEIVIRPHEYDGIREFDQKMPNWWLFIFYGSIAFFVGWWLLYYQFGFMLPDGVRVESEMRQVEKRKADALQAMLAKLDDHALINQFAKDDSVVARGRETFMTNCTACHGQDLSGTMDLGNGTRAPLPGLPLTDGQWKYGAKPMDLFKLINGGTPPESSGHNGARMEAWGQKMPPMKIVELVAFVISQNPKDFPTEGNN